MQNGKGSKPRPIKNLKEYLSNFDSINWKSKKQEKTSCNCNLNVLPSLNDESKSNSISTATDGEIC